jgi:hypothetical protein
MAVVPPLSEPLSDPPVRLRLSSPAEVVAAVPYLIGFTPERSVVVLCLAAKQLGLTMRLDIDMPGDELRDLVLARLKGDGADTAVIVLFDPPASSGSRRPGAQLAKSLIRAVRRDGLHVQDALGIREGRFWSYLCSNPGCCPPEGRPVPPSGDADHSRVAATFVALGSAPMSSREQLAASVTVTDARRVELAPIYEQALARPAAHPIDRWWTAVERYTAGPPRPGSALTPAEAARLVVSLRAVAVRDEVLSWTTGDEVTGVLAVLRELAPQALPPYDAQLLATLAWAAYSFGDGALAAVALERALRAEPDHSLARLLMLALEAGVTPEQLRTISRAVSGFLDGPEFPDAR